MFFILDLMVAALLPFIIFILVASRRIPASMWPLFWLGVLIGALWEFGFHFTGPLYSDMPSYIQGANFPFHPILQPVAHSLWDGGLFILGIACVWRLTPGPHLTVYSLPEISVLISFGFFQSIIIEFLAASMEGGWHYTVSAWNPSIGNFGGATITLAPFLVWLIAPPVFYFFAVPVHMGSIAPAKYQIRAT